MNSKSIEEWREEREAKRREERNLRAENILKAESNLKQQERQQRKILLRDKRLRVERRIKAEKELKAMPIPDPIEYILGTKKLSILICSLKGREGMLRNLMSILRGQMTNDVEILVEKNNRKITIGAKRNILLGRARGDYVVFVDDDDRISGNYISKILNAISTLPDCVGIEGEIHFKKKGITRKFIHSIQYDKWFESRGIYYRCPNHLNPVKREIALKIAFPNVSKREDEHYSLRIRLLLKTEVYIKGTVYFYGAS